jgi:peptidoglycan hydrolase-like protein with peptidoglycan-binding domain
VASPHAAALLTSSGIWKAVKSFQKAKDLVADARVGDMTRAAINKSLAGNG